MTRPAGMVKRPAPTAGMVGRPAPTAVDADVYEWSDLSRSLSRCLVGR